MERSSLRGKPFILRQTAETAWSEAFYAAAIWASGIVPPSIIESEFLERLR